MPRRTILALVPITVSALRCAAPARRRGVALRSAATSEVEAAYFKEQDTVYDVDEGAWKSDVFWAEFTKAYPSWQKDAELERFRGFVENLRTEPPGVDVFCDNNQQLLSQYIYPGLGQDEASADVPRSAYPHDAYPELAALREKLTTDVAPHARAELAQVLGSRPLARDEDGFDEDAGEWDPLGLNEQDEPDETWQKAAWYGWQFLSLRGTQKLAPKTTQALLEAMGDLGPAHRFVGFTRQKAGVRGTVHSDGRNYMLSTLTPVDAPPGCAIVVDDQEATIVTGGDAIVLDNTLPHYVYNNADTDRMCLMSECWHPALTAVERDALATLFAVKDRFTVQELGMAPWGYGEEDLAAALKSGAVNDLDYWKRLDYKGPKKKKVKKKATSNKRSAGKKGPKKKAFG
eukprot:CAMPEP_0119260670 /NCGR_PEP_ID=MMETSP1329-20130426/943_1 /TAXON_ID=114041 /ORGANISM="Genus nov. species nov., Strain RCC1024" /LENGTH=402 /DNA_ID=CAMNT_0007260103 /DNA_START=168 /DNA_END=1376 /DNA_ORIENTATION=+